MYLASAIGVSESADEQAVLVSSAEFVLKSSPVRRTLEQRLVDDLRFALHRAGLRDFAIEKVASRIIIKSVGNAQLAARTVARVFGVAYATPAIKVSGSMEVILSALVRTAQTVPPRQTFAIRCHRSSPSHLSTRDVEREGGSEILKQLAERSLKVNLSRPDVLISIDLIGENAYVYTEKLAGPGGLPISSKWKMLAVLDCGLLSLFAAYVMMRRGCLVQLIVPSSSIEKDYPIDRQLALARKLRQFVTRESYRAFVLEIDKTPNPQKQAVRLMSLEIAKARRFRGVILADISGSISRSRALYEKSRALGLPIFQPLIGLEINDLKELCQLFDVDLIDLQRESSAGQESNQPVNLNLAEIPVTSVSL